jgi:hypothetical protein
MGPGGRLRPSPRTHRPPGHADLTRPSAFLAHDPADGPMGGLGASSTGLLGAPDDAAYDDGPELEGLDVAGPPGFDRRDRSPADAPRTHGRDDGPRPAFEAQAPLDDLERDVDREPQAVHPSPGRSPAGPPFERRGGPGGGSPRFDRRGGPPRPAMPPNVAAAAPDHDERPERQVRQERTAPICTSPQLRRFIKSRAYIPMHELRRRFAIEGGDDDVTGIDLEKGRIYVGLPAMEGHLLGDLLRGGEVGFELSMDPQTPVVVGVYAMRPVPRP